MHVHRKSADSRAGEKLRLSHRAKLVTHRDHDISSHSSNGGRMMSETRMSETRTCLWCNETYLPSATDEGLCSWRCDAAMKQFYLRQSIKGLTSCQEFVRDGMRRFRDSISK